MSVIYKIYCKDENIKDCYIGSTKYFTNRKRRHKYDCSNINCMAYNYKLYKFIRENGGFTNFDFEILETFNTIDTQDLYKIEGQYMENNNANLNDRKSFILHNEKTECIYCKSIVRRSNIVRHQKTPKCLTIRNTNQN